MSGADWKGGKESREVRVRHAPSVLPRLAGTSAPFSRGENESDVLVLGKPINGGRLI